MIPADEALQQLRDGNARFVASNVETSDQLSRRAQYADEQSPFAIVLGCSDSRVPVEIIFDQGIGDLFVIRIPGNIVGRSQLGAIEFAAETFDVRLVVVLGHTHCGAIGAAIEELQNPRGRTSDSQRFFVNEIRPSVEQVMADGWGHDPDRLVAQVGRENVRRATKAVRHGSKTIERLAEQEGLVIVGAEYSLRTGVVEFF